MAAHLRALNADALYIALYFSKPQTRKHVEQPRQQTNTSTLRSLEPIREYNCANLKLRGLPVNMALPECKHDRNCRADKINQNKPAHVVNEAHQPTAIHPIVSKGTNNGTETPSLGVGLSCVRSLLSTGCPLLPCLAPFRACGTSHIPFPPRPLSPNN